MTVEELLNSNEDISLEAGLNCYFEELRSYLDFPAKDVENYVADMRTLLDQHLSNIPDPTFEDAFQFLGSPKDSADVFLENYDTNKLKRHRLRKLLCKRLAIILVIVILIVSLCATYHFMTNPQAKYSDDFQLAEILVDDPTAINPCK